jgi:hypothetical protein
MKSRTMKFTLDCSKVGNQLCIDGIRQGDANSIVFIISLANGINLLDIVAGKEESVVVTMYGKKPDGTTIVRDCGINEDGNITYTIHTQDTTCVGIVSYQLVVTSTKEKILASPVFSTMVEERNLFKTYTVLTAQPDDWADGYDKYYYYEDGRFYKLNRFESESAPEWVINKYYSVNDNEVESTSDFDALAYALLRAKQYSDKSEEYLAEVKKKADKATTLAGYGITDALRNAKGTVSTNNLADNCVSSNKLSADVRANLNSKAESAKVSQQLLLKADASSVYTKSESDALLKAKANSADVDASVKAINTTIANNQKSVNASLESLNTALANKADTDVVNEVKQRAESNTTAIGLKVNRTDFNNTVTNLTNSINGRADSSSVYSKVETDDLLGAKADKVVVDTSLANKANRINSSNIFDFDAWAKELQKINPPVFHGTLDELNFDEKSFTVTPTEHDTYTNTWQPQYAKKISVKPNTKYWVYWLTNNYDCNTMVFLNGIATNGTFVTIKGGKGTFVTNNDTSFITLRFGTYGNTTFKVSEIMITEKEAIYLPNKVAEGVPEVADEILAFEKTTQTSLDGKYDSSNIELGTATLTPYSTLIDKIKSATCLYEKIGDIVIVNVTVIMNATSLGGTSAISLLNMPFPNKSDVIVQDIGISKNGGMFRGSVSKSAWLQFTPLNKQAYNFVADEQVNFSLIYKI